MGKDEDGRTSAIISAQKLDSKGIGFGTEGAFKPWWDDLYNNTAVSVKVKKEINAKKDKKEKECKKSKKESKVKKSEKVKISEKVETKKSKDSKSKRK